MKKGMVLGKLQNFSARLLLLAFVSLFAVPVWAGQDGIATRAGLARIVDGAGGTRMLMVGDVPVSLPDDPFSAFIAEKLGDLLLVLYSQGGNACPAFFVWVHAVPGAVRSTQGFGTCADQYTLSNDSETVSLTMVSFVPGQGDVTFIYDGRNPVREVQNPLAASGMAPGDGWDFWIGRHPYELFNAADLQAEFVKLMGQAALTDAQRMMAVANNMEQVGNWIVGTGCQAHMCGVNVAAVALNLSDGRVLVALVQGDAPARLWGDPKGELPGVIAQLIAGKL